MNKTTSKKKTKNVKTYACFHIIPYIHSPMMALFPHILMATMTTFPGTSLITKKINLIEYARKVSFGTQTSQVYQFC